MLLGVHPSSPGVQAEALGREGLGPSCREGETTLRTPLEPSRPQTRRLTKHRCSSGELRKRDLTLSLSSQYKPELYCRYRKLEEPGHKGVTKGKGDVCKMSKGLRGADGS